MEIELAIQIFLFFAVIYLSFFKSYLTEKGKSAALKEDIQALTNEVESVKNEFIKEQELLKTNLQRILTNEISYRNEERITLIQFHSIISEWLYSIHERNYNSYNKTNIDLLINSRNTNASFYSKTGIAKSKIHLLVEDDNLVKTASNLFSAVLAFHHWTDAEFLKLQQNSESQKSLDEQFMTIIQNYEKNKELANKMAIQQEKLFSTAKELMNYYYENRNDKYKKIIPFENEFETLVKIYLKK